MDEQDIRVCKGRYGEQSRSSSSEDSSSDSGYRKKKRFDRFSRESPSYVNSYSKENIKKKRKKKNKRQVQYLASSPKQGTSSLEPFSLKRFLEPFLEPFSLEPFLEPFPAFSPIMYDRDTVQTQVKEVKSKQVTEVKSKQVTEVKSKQVTEVKSKQVIEVKSVKEDMVNGADLAALKIAVQTVDIERKNALTDLPGNHQDM